MNQRDERICRVGTQEEEEEESRGVSEMGGRGRSFERGVVEWRMAASVG